MAIRPAFQFYPADWRNNAKLRRCSEAARGAWIDVLCILHDSDEYGVLRWPLADIAQAAGVPLRLLEELARKEVLKGADSGATSFVYRPRHGGQEGEPVTLVTDESGPCWYCSRFVRDEYIRQRRGTSTRFSDTKQPPKQQPKSAPKGGIGGRQGDGASSSSSSSVKQEQKTAPVGELLADVDPQVASDFIALRHRLRAPITKTAIAGIRREAEKAGLTLTSALTLCCERSWRGFKAEWVADGKSAPAASNPWDGAL